MLVNGAKIYKLYNLLNDFYRKLLITSRQKIIKNICKAISVLDAIICLDWIGRCYSYNSKWAKVEEFCEMRDGSGDQILILFRDDGCVINGMSHEFYPKDKSKLTQGLPKIFETFIFGEPVHSIGTTFCLWITELKNWQVGKLESFVDNSQELLNIFEGQPQTYINWATEYFNGSFKESGIRLETVKKIYSGQTLTKEMVLLIVDELEDWKQLESDLIEINYPYNFKG